MIKRLRHRGQSLAEYALLIAMISSALFSMQLYLKRGLQHGIKLSANELEEQASVYNPRTRSWEIPSLQSERESIDSRSDMESNSEIAISLLPGGAQKVALSETATTQTTYEYQATTGGKLIGGKSSSTVE